jgi:hypothetical protein
MPKAKKKKRGKGRKRFTRTRWSKRELKLLKKLHRSVSNIIIAKRLKRTLASVTGMAHLLCLYKNHARLVQMGRQNIAKRWN